MLLDILQHTQRVYKATLLSLEFLNVGVYFIANAGAVPGTPLSVMWTGPAGVGDHRRVTGRITREPRRPSFVRVRTGLAGGGGLRWLIDADFEAYFDTIDHGHLLNFLDLRIKDGVIRRMIDKWHKAGVLDAGVLPCPETDSHQGSFVLPILSNIFLHHVMDVWMKDAVLEEQRRHLAREIRRHCNY